MGINVVVFLLVLGFPQILNELALQPAIILSQPWTIITSIFTHQQFYHILANMISFYFFASFVGQLVGNKFMLIIYFAGGIVGSLFFMLLAPLSAAIGASGAVFALGGALVVLRPNTKVVAFPIPIPMPIWVAIIGGFVIMSIIPGIAWQAHLGGLIAGLVFGWFLRKRARMVLI
jgi:uncharacterized protein